MGAPRRTMVEIIPGPHPKMWIIGCAFAIHTQGYQYSHSRYIVSVDLAISRLGMIWKTNWTEATYLNVQRNICSQSEIWGPAQAVGKGEAMVRHGIKSCLQGWSSCCEPVIADDLAVVCQLVVPAFHQCICWPNPQLLSGCSRWFLLFSTWGWLSNWLARIFRRQRCPPHNYAARSVPRHPKVKRITCTESDAQVALGSWQDAGFGRGHVQA